MAAYAPGPMEGDKEGCKSIIVKQAKEFAVVAVTAFVFTICLVLAGHAATIARMP